MSAYRNQALTKPVIGGTTQSTNPTNSIIIPAYETHADRIFSGTPSTVDDHFDGSSIDAKWTQNTSITGTLTYPVLKVEGSKFCLGGMSSSTVDNVQYGNQISMALPNSNSFTITIRIDAVISCDYRAGSYAYFAFYIASGSGVGPAFILEAVWVAAGQIYYGMYAGGGTAGYTGLSNYFDPMPWPKYLRIKWIQSTRVTEWYYSNDGITFQQLWDASGSSTGLSAGVDPTTVYLYQRYRNQATAFTQIDWIKFVNT